MLLKINFTFIFSLQVWLQDGAVGANPIAGDWFAFYRGEELVAKL